MDVSLHLVQFSTGAGSAEVARRVVERYGRENTVLLTADTLVEDEDNWRFAREVWEALGQPRWEILRDGRTPMQVGWDERVVPNNRMAVCSKLLKRKVLRDYLDGHFDPASSVVHMGYDWTEPHRLEKARPHWEPWPLEAVLMEPPLLQKAELLQSFRDQGIEPPRLYAEGFSHANCGGACVRGGQAQWALLLQTHPGRYRDWETDEEAVRFYLDKDVSILRDRRGGKVKPMTLRAFRQRLEADGAHDSDDWGACGCSMDE